MESTVNQYSSSFPAKIIAWDDAVFCIPEN
jgi:hypothetical protein